MDHPQRANPEVPRRIGVREFRGNMTNPLCQTRQCKSFIITSNDEVVAELNPPSKLSMPRRLLGVLRGKITMALGSDTLPASILTAMEGEAE